MNRYYVTTPLYYVNDKPHIGHAYTEIAADTIARYRRFKGDEVFFLTGTDEHGQKIEQAAGKAGMPPKDFADQVVPRFLDVWKRLDISYDYFLRTTEQRHIQTVQKVLSLLFEKGDIHISEYEGWYCTPCETFWTETQLKEQGSGVRGQGSEKTEVICLDCKRPIEKITEKNYFFRLSKYQGWLIDYIQSHPKFIQPSTRREEVLSFLKQPLNDLCISRPKERLQWGIPIPFSENHVTYVWFDALINYISGIDYLEVARSLELGARSKDSDSTSPASGFQPAASPLGELPASSRFSKFWPADLHLIGKDILRPHAIYWPIMLHALGLEPPKQVFAHGWWTMQEEKMSKSKGNIVDPVDVCARYGEDVFRYFLLREVTFGLDGAYSEGALASRFNSDLANDLGNLFHRTLTMVEKYYSGKVPQVTQPFSVCAELENLIRALPQQLDQAMEELNFSSALSSVWACVNRANKFIEEIKPWELEKKQEKQKLAQVIYLLVDLLRIVTLAISPFMPHSASKMWEQLNIGSSLESANLSELEIGKTATGFLIKKGNPLFPRLDIKKGN